MPKMTAGICGLALWSIGWIGTIPFAWSQVVDPLPTIEPLRVPPPAPADAAFNKLVKSKDWLVVLGKALFWDGAVGSDGQACASCHFHAGADTRVVNQLSPGLKIQPFADVAFGGGPNGVGALTRSGQAARPNLTLQAGDFPFHKLSDALDRNSTVSFDMNDVTSSAGVFDGTILGIDDPIKTRKGKRDLCSPVLDDTTIFKLDVNGPKRTRKVEPRNSPTVINAAYFYRNFWDGRANNAFNGVTPLGRRDVILDPQTRILRNGPGGLQPEALLLENSSLASQAVGPPGSNFEMACAGRPFAYIGKKLLSRRVLRGQIVHPEDSVFSATPTGSLVVAPNGLGVTYETLVQNALVDDLWNATGTFNKDASGQPIAAGTAGYRQIEWNFSLAFGLAIDAYERTLISDQTPFDLGTMSAGAKAGEVIFTGKGKCVNCHTGPLFSGAAVPPRERAELIENMIVGDGGTALYDGGFYNIGVRPTFEDLGLGDEIPAGYPLSFTRQFKSGNRVDQFPDPADGAGTSRVAVDGAFKVPSLRNVAMTAPYFHNGGQSTLEQVVDFYNRGGDRRGPDGNDTTGTGAGGNDRPITGPSMGGSNLDADIQPLGLTPREKKNLVTFLKALSDQRVACHMAPFDHPELRITNGQSEIDPFPDRLRDKFLKVRAVGRSGVPDKAWCDPNTGDLFKRKLRGGILQ